MIGSCKASVKAPEDWRTPKRFAQAGCLVDAIAFWSAAVLRRFGNTCLAFIVCDFIALILASGFGLLTSLVFFLPARHIRPDFSGDAREAHQHTLEAAVDVFEGFGAFALDVFDFFFVRGEAAVDLGEAQFGEFMVVAFGGFADFERRLVIDAHALFIQRPHKEHDGGDGGEQREDDDDGPLENFSGDTGEIGGLGEHGVVES